VLKEVRNDPTDHLQEKLQADAEKEASRTEADVYREVFIDEANTHLLTSVQKTEGTVVVVIMN
jgi:hypothetical protein